MTTGRSNKLVGQTGEYMVAAELSRRGLVATTFTGNVPHYDIIASDERGRHTVAQVKTSQSASWQLNISHFCEIQFKRERQIVGKAKRCPVNRLVVVFVQLAENRDDRFYICTWIALRDILVADYEDYLKQHGGRRPKNWESLHTQLIGEQIAPYENKWQTIVRALG